MLKQIIRINNKIIKNKNLNRLYRTGNDCRLIPGENYNRLNTGIFVFIIIRFTIY